jgi:hypothetical protein
LDIANWFSAQNPSLNGTPIKLDSTEISRGLAVAPDQQRFVLGTNYWVRAFDQSGTQLWRRASPAAETWFVNISRDGRLVVAAFGDGTIRWLRPNDGEELLALTPVPTFSEKNQLVVILSRL